MSAKPTRKKDQKPGKHGKISIDKIVEKDLEIPADDLKRVKGGMISRIKPKLVPIPR